MNEIQKKKKKEHIKTIRPSCEYIYLYREKKGLEQTNKSRQPKKIFISNPFQSFVFQINK